VFDKNARISLTDVLTRASEESRVKRQLDRVDAVDATDDDDATATVRVDDDVWQSWPPPGAQWPKRDDTLPVSYLGCVITRRW
jgi:hypothetical protein